MPFKASQLSGKGLSTWPEAPREGILAIKITRYIVDLEPVNLTFWLKWLCVWNEYLNNENSDFL